ncbi:PREDICTED: phytosulfokines 5-like isoform X2 [Camelina sativa]|uniref:Phytosulfokine n=1 Tax=Camelina sativa TaxID=90675 RepID=A0ABM0XTL0_CAMSA|nr:PREDICTED: phytosulfokines 5-like isoform X2 [Camelina sativa]
MEKKLGIMFFLFVVLLILQFSELRTAHQRSLQGDNEEKGNKNDNWVWAKATQADKASEMAQELSQLMGEEKCEERDEECTKRRMITESHLDYIYTQSHDKP